MLFNYTICTKKVIIVMKAKFLIDTIGYRFIICCVGSVIANNTISFSFFTSYCICVTIISNIYDDIGRFTDISAIAIYKIVIMM